MRDARPDLHRCDVVAMNAGFAVVWGSDAAGLAIIPVRYNNEARRRSDVALCPADVSFMGVSGKNLILSVSNVHRVSRQSVIARVGVLPTDVAARLTRAVRDEVQAQACEASQVSQHHERAVRM